MTGLRLTLGSLLVLGLAFGAAWLGAGCRLAYAERRTAAMEAQLAACRVTVERLEAWTRSYDEARPVEGWLRVQLGIER